MSRLMVTRPKTMSRMPPRSENSPDHREKLFAMASRRLYNRTCKQPDVEFLRSLPHRKSSPGCLLLRRREPNLRPEYSPTASQDDNIETDSARCLRLEACLTRPRRQNGFFCGFSGS
jgi:hypothetical protein